MYAGNNQTWAKAEKTQLLGGGELSRQGSEGVSNWLFVVAFDLVYLAGPGAAGVLAAAHEESAAKFRAAASSRPTSISTAAAAASGSPVKGVAVGGSGTSPPRPGPLLKVPLHVRKLALKVLL
jgi:hypothetical protein